MYRENLYKKSNLTSVDNQDILNRYIIDVDNDIKKLFAFVINDREVVDVISSSTTITDLYTNVLVDTSTNTITVTLPTAVNLTGKVFVIKDSTGGAGTRNITVDGAGSETIDGSTTYTISSNYGSVKIISDGTGWLIV